VSRADALRGRARRPTGPDAGKATGPAEDRVTPPELVLGRRRLLAAAAGLALGCGPSGSVEEARSASTTEAKAFPVPVLRPSPFDTGEPPTSRRDATRYNNFYEFGPDKRDPARRAHILRTRPWTLRVDGEVHRPRTIDLDLLLRRYPAEERIYRLRCVEAWSMVIPWIGFPLARLLEECRPTSHARYVAFESLLDPEQMPAQHTDLLPWPYREGLRLDEAMHPLVILATGMYGEVLPPQNGAPLRLVVPWKYGFKSIKSVVRIRLTRRQPPTTWNQRAPREYGFFANVNPEVDHPRWSQRRERRIGELRRRPTLPFNGYAEQVAHLYRGMDLRRFF